MSLARLALRIAATKALTGQTLAGARVRDSAVEGIDLQVQTERQPFVVIYTDDHTRVTTGKDLRHGDDDCELVIEVAVAARVPVAIPGEEEGGEATEVVVPHTDAGMELMLDLIGHQAIEALSGGASVWAAIWRDFVLRVRRIVSRRGAGTENGVRFAARQIVMTVDLLADPVRGEAMNGPWVRLLAAMEADSDLADIGAVIRYAIEGDAPLTAEAVAASRQGLSPATVDAIGIAPVRDEDGNAVDLTEIEVQTGGAPGDPWVIEAEDEVVDDA